MRYNQKILQCSEPTPSRENGANRLIKITQLSSGTPLISEFSYDGLGRRVRIVERTNGVVESDKRFLWCATELCEERDSTGATVAKRFFGPGEEISAVPYFFSRDHLGSVREMMDTNGTVRARYEFDPHGRRTKVSGDLEADFAFTGHYYHQASGLHLAMYRGYDSGTARWLSRDAIEEQGGLNAYVYTLGNPVVLVDRLGLYQAIPPALLPAGLANSPAYNQGVVEGANEAAKKCWNSVNTVIGLFWGGISLPFGGDVSFDNNAIQFENHPFMPFGAITIGNTISYPPGFGPNFQLPNGTTVAQHELQHTYQGEILGPLYLPAHIIAGGFSLITTGTWHNNNVLERGPSSNPPEPF